MVLRIVNPSFSGKAMFVDSPSDELGPAYLSMNVRPCVRFVVRGPSFMVVDGSVFLHNYPDLGGPDLVSC